VHEVNMKATTIHEFGGPEVFRYEDVPTPRAQCDHVVIRVAACGINRYDLYLRAGAIRKDIPMPHVMGADVVGTIAETGVGVSGWRAGERVIAAPGFPVDPADWDYKPENQAPSFTVTGTLRWGGYAEFMSIPARFVFRDETGLSAEQVAAVPLVLVTAVHAVKTLGEVRAGAKVLVQAGASGSGGMCIQMAKALGAEVATTVGSPEKFGAARACGADLIIDYSRENFAERALEWTGGRGVDVVIDNVGGSVFEDNLRALKLGGIFVNFGLVGGIRGTLNFRTLFFKQLTLRGSMMGSLDEFRFGLELLKQGKVKPILDRTFPLNEAAEAHRYIESRQVRGKVVLVSGEW
jgi:NADPH:quinone reductase-like Zn-dependent oxidoreductase